MNYKDATISDIRDALDSKSMSVSQVVNEALQQIKKTEELNIFIDKYEKLDGYIKNAEEMIEKGTQGKLTGVPIAIKDNICVEDEKVSAASKILEGFKSPYDATVIQKLKNEGAIPIGRVNMDEFAMGSSTINSSYGTTKNPFDKERVSGGSSGGSAASVSSGCTPLSLGSDTGGSIRQPASFCGVVGLKPTYGSVSRHGLIALSSSLDVIGPIGKSVDDVETVFNIIEGVDLFDSVGGIFPKKNIEKKKVIGIPKGILEWGEVKEIVKKTFNETVEKMKESGYEVKEVDIPLMNESVSIYYIIQPAEASSNLARFDGVRYGKRGDGEDLFETYIKTRGENFGDEVSRRIVLGTYVLSAGYFDAYYKKAVDVRSLLSKQFDSALKDVDVIALPTTPDVAFKETDKKTPLEMYAEDIFTLQANLTGMPSISVPMNKNELPLGIQFIGRHNSEKTLFDYGRLVESLV